jgi:lipopolysaccharide biosynthesis protein
MVIPLGGSFTIPDLRQNWDFQPSPVQRWERRKMLELFISKGHRSPNWQEIKPITPKQTWLVYFMYTPTGVLSAAHAFTLSRLQDMGLPVLVICAATGPDRVPPDLRGLCDALFWKDLPGYDFSAYTLALRQISKHSPGADAFVFNDSVYGPFGDLKSILENAAWDFTGLTASNHRTNHIQSYAFVLRQVTPSRMAALSTVFFPLVSISEPAAVIELQELRLARVASRFMKVGALWFGDTEKVIDPTLVRPMELVDGGFPFLKRSLLGKHKSFIDQELMIGRLQQLNHPIDMHHS